MLSRLAECPFIRRPQTVCRSPMDIATMSSLLVWQVVPPPTGGGICQQGPLFIPRLWLAGEA